MEITVRKFTKIIACLAAACATPTLAASDDSGVPSVDVAPVPSVDLAPMPAVYGPPVPISFVDASGPPPVAAPDAPAAAAALPDADDRSLIEKIGPRKLLAFTAANGLDKWSTRRCLRRRTCKESGAGVRALWGERPSDVELVGAFAIDQALYVGGSIIFGESFGYDSGATKAFQIGMIGTRGVIGTLNLRF